MALAATRFHDNMTVIKSFERGAIFSPTPEATFAMATPIVQNMRTQAQTYVEQDKHRQSLANTGTLSEKQQAKNDPSVSAEKPAGNITNMDKADENDEGFISTIKQNFVPTEQGVFKPTDNAFNADFAGKVFNSECIPCGGRLNMLGELFTKEALLGALEFNPITVAWKQMLQEAIRQLQSLQELFDTENWKGYMDLCVFIKWLKDFVCIPDLAALISILNLMMSKTIFDFGGIYGILLQIVAPLLQPLLSNLANMIERYLNLVIAPIECIVESLQELIRKLDVSAFFDNMKNASPNLFDPATQTGIDATSNFFFGGPTEKQKDVIQKKGTTPLLNAEPGEVNTSLGKRATQSANESAKDAAAAELKSIEQAAQNVDGADPAAIESHNQQKAAAKQKSKEASNTASSSQAEPIDLEGLIIAPLKSMIAQIMAIIREAIAVVEGYASLITDELKKLMLEFGGGQGGLIGIIIKKMFIVQMIALLSNIITALKNGSLECDDEEEQSAAITNHIPVGGGTTVWTDDEGNIHIDEDPDSEAINAITPTKQTSREKDAGITPSDKLNSLIQLTGDAALDTEIARTVAALTTPVNVTFKCPLQTSVRDVEQVNKWIMELNQ